MIDAAVVKFRDAAIAKGDFATPASLDRKLHGQMREAASFLLSGSSEGRDAFSSLLQDDSPQVRGWVGAQLLADGDLRALPVMERLCDEPGIAGFTAKVTLDEFKAGRLAPHLESRRPCKPLHPKARSRQTDGNGTKIEVTGVASQSQFECPIVLWVWQMGPPEEIALPKG